MSIKVNDYVRLAYPEKDTTSRFSNDINWCLDKGFVKVGDKLQVIELEHYWGKAFIKVHIPKWGAWIVDRAVFSSKQRVKNLPSWL